jgi:hypothetical protein
MPASLALDFAIICNSDACLGLGPANFCSSDACLAQRPAKPDVASHRPQYTLRPPIEQKENALV